MRAKLLILTMVIMLAIMFAIPSVSFAELKEGTTTQGEFALWLVKVVGAQSKLPPAAQGKDAINFLMGLGVAPEGGWAKDKPITKEFLTSLLPDEDTSKLSFDELVSKVQEAVKNLFSDKKLGVFRGTSSASGSTPAV